MPLDENFVSVRPRDGNELALDHDNMFKVTKNEQRSLVFGRRGWLRTLFAALSIADELCS